MKEKQVNLPSRDEFDEVLMGKAKEVYHTFDYSPTLDYEQLRDIHVPSRWIQSEKVLRDVLKYMCENGYLIYDGLRYKKVW
jgi:hypothetical protein